MSRRHTWKVELIPLDYESQEHGDRLYKQRLACGWRADEVPAWVEAGKRGELVFYWAVLTDTVPDRAKLLETHIQEYTNEAPPLRDTAKAVCLTPREPTLKEFVPIGHVALGTHVPEEDDKLNLPSEGVFWVHYLYVSYSLHGHGFGSATMDQIESVAVQEPLNARIMVLSTIEKETVRDVMKDQGFRPPAVAAQVMYEQRGYEECYRQAGGYMWERPQGAIPLDVVYMKKRVG